MKRSLWFVFALFIVLLIGAGCQTPGNSKIAVYPYTAQTAEHDITIVNGCTYNAIDIAINGTIVASRSMPGGIQRVPVKYKEGEVTIIARAVTRDGKYRGIAEKSVTLFLAMPDSSDNEHTITFFDRDFDTGR